METNWKENLSVLIEQRIEETHGCYIAGNKGEQWKEEIIYPAVQQLLDQQKLSYEKQIEEARKEGYKEGVKEERERIIDILETKYFTQGIPNELLEELKTNQLI